MRLARLCVTVGLCLVLGGLSAGCGDGWSDAEKENFLSSCLAAAAARPGYCQCALDYVKGRHRPIELDRILEGTGEAAIKLQQRIQQRCLGSRD